MLTELMNNELECVVTTGKINCANKLLHHGKLTRI